MSKSNLKGAIALGIAFYKKGDGPSSAAQRANNATVEEYKNAGIEPTTKVARVSSKQISNIVAKLEITHNYNKALTPAQIEKIRIKREAGYTLAELATMNGLSVETIRRYCLMPIFPERKTVDI